MKENLFAAGGRISSPASSDIPGPSAEAPVSAPSAGGTYKERISAALHRFAQRQVDGDLPRERPKKKSRADRTGPHKQLVRALVAALKARGAMVTVRNVALAEVRGRKVMLGVKGEADVQGVLAGRPFAFEVKTGSARPTPAQEAWLARAAAAGVVASVVRSVEEALLLLGVK